MLDQVRGLRDPKVSPRSNFQSQGGFYPKPVPGGSKPFEQGFEERKSFEEDGKKKRRRRGKRKSRSKKTREEKERGKSWPRRGNSKPASGKGVPPLEFKGLKENWFRGSGSRDSSPQGSFIKAEGVNSSPQGSWIKDFQKSKDPPRPAQKIQVLYSDSSQGTVYTDVPMAYVQAAKFIIEYLVSLFVQARLTGSPEDLERAWNELQRFRKGAFVNPRAGEDVYVVVNNFPDVTGSNDWQNFPFSLTATMGLKKGNELDDTRTVIIESRNMKPETLQSCQKGIHDRFHRQVPKKLEEIPSSGDRCSKEELRFSQTPFGFPIEGNYGSSGNSSEEGYSDEDSSSEDENDVHPSGSSYPPLFFKESTRNWHPLSPNGENPPKQSYFSNVLW